MNIILQELLTKDKPDGNKEKEMSIVSYPKIGEAYDPKAINTWSNLRGFQSSAVSTLASYFIFYCNARQLIFKHTFGLTLNV